MKRKTWYKLHKWIAVGSGAALLVWCVSGVFIILPILAPSIDGLPSPQSVGPNADYSALTVSPAQAVDALVATGVDSPVVLAFLRKVGDRTAYDLRTEDGHEVLIDAATGSPFVIDSAAAVSLARHSSGSSAEVIGFAHVEAPYAKYPFGPLPAYTVEFADAPSVAFTAAVTTGQVMRSGTVSRFRVFVENTHSFRQLDRFMTTKISYWMLFLFTALTAVAALIGFWIAIPRSWLPTWLGGPKQRLSDPNLSTGDTG